MPDPVNLRKISSKGCGLGCDDDESIRHLFVKCATYQDWRDEAMTQVVATTKLKLTLNVDGAVKENLITAAKSLFTDSSTIWPLHLTLFYLGHMH